MLPRLPEKRAPTGAEPGTLNSGVLGVEGAGTRECAATAEGVLGVAGAALARGSERVTSWAPASVQHKNVSTTATSVTTKRNM